MRPLTIEGTFTSLPDGPPMHPALKHIVALYQVGSDQWIAILALWNAHHPYSTHRIYRNGECLSGTYHETLIEAFEVAKERWQEVA